MKKTIIILFLAFGLASPLVQAQEKDEEIFIDVDEPAQFEGGMGAFYKFVGTTMKYPKLARRIGIEGKIFVQFVVEKDGSISHIKVIKGLGGDCDEETVRVLLASPKWTPGKQDGTIVRQRLSLPFIFKLNGEGSNAEKLLIANGKILGLFKDQSKFFQKINSQTLIDFKPVNPEEAIQAYGQDAKNGALVINWKESE